MTREEFIALENRRTLISEAVSEAYREENDPFKLSLIVNADPFVMAADVIKYLINELGIEDQAESAFSEYVEKIKEEKTNV